LNSAPTLTHFIFAINVQNNYVFSRTLPSDLCDSSPLSFFDGACGLLSYHNALITTRTKRGSNVHGVCLDRLRRWRRHICRREVSAVVLQIGSNDLMDDRCSVEQFVADCSAYIHYLQTRCQVQRVVIMEILHRKERSRYCVNMTMDDYNRRKVDNTNTQLKTMCSTSTNLVFWHHIWHVRHLGAISRDGIHLNSTSLKNYWRRVRAAVMRAVRGWLYPYSVIMWLSIIMNNVK